MSNNWIKKVHQSFCSLEDKSSYDEIQFYCNYSDKVLSEMDSLGYEDCNFKNNNLKFLLKLKNMVKYLEAKHTKEKK